MILMTLNYRGLASLPKKLAVKRLIDKQSLDIIYLQETMCEGCMMVKDLELILKGWQFVSVDARGIYGGLLLGWRTRNFLLLNAWAMTSGVCVVLHSIELQLDITFLNLFGPYLDREFFWNHLSGMDCFNCPYLVLGGDLNFSWDCLKFGGLTPVWTH